ncbi:MAG: ribbon-helix-helix protein, CopG family [Thermomicrobiales bacterium]|nr:ribbon-helix-helix protein, CopG family [Thermomicrobiales bacterium]
MSDVLIRNVPSEVLAALDFDAEKLGLSRSEYLRRILDRAARPKTRPTTLADLERTAEIFRDALDEEFMKGAWN